MNIIQKAVKVQAQATPRPAASVIVEAVAVAGESPPVPTVSDATPDPGRVVRFSGLAQNGFFGPESDDPRLLAEIRHLKRAVIRAAAAGLDGSPANIVAVTSALPEAGKTYLAASLAQALTLERDRSTLLVDGDDVRCTLSRSLGQYGVKGFFDLLHDEALAPQALTLPTDMPSLGFLPCGGRYADSAELLSSRRATDVLATLAKREPERLIIIDCPPLLGTPNAAALTSLAGQTLVVVEAGITDSDTLTRALGLLSRDRPIGLVINKVPRKGLLSSRAGSYYYYYGPRE